MDTGDVRLLVEEVLSSLSKPYTEHVIDEVFQAIEQTAAWRLEYDRLCISLGKALTNNSVGYWVASALGKVGKRKVSAVKSTLNGSYSILDTDARSFSRKPSEQEALNMMSDYYHSNRASVAPDIKMHRDQIIELIMAGTAPVDAFALVQSGSA